MRTRLLSALIFLLVSGLMGHAQTVPAPDAALTNAIRMAEARLRAERRDLAPADLTRLAETVGRSNWLNEAIVQRILANDFTNAAALLKVFPGTAKDLQRHGQPMLSQAIQGNDSAQVEFLLAHKADPNLLPPYGELPLFNALQNHHWINAAHLVRAGASLTRTNRYGGSPAQEFFSNWYPGTQDETNRIAFLELILEHGFDPFAPSHQNADGTHSFLEEFLQKHARNDAHIWGSGGRVNLGSPQLPGSPTPPRPDICALLLTNQARADRRTPAGETAPHLAAYWGRTNALEFLFAADFSADLTNAAGLTALQAIAGLDPASGMVAARSIEPLLAHDATVNVFTAAGLGRTNELADLLRNDPALANARDSFGRTPLHYALTALPPYVAAGFSWIPPRGGMRPPQPLTNTPPQLQVAGRLLECGADPAAATTRRVPRVTQNSEPLPAGTTPLHLAAQRGHAALLRQLLVAKAPVAAADANGDTPLHFAARTWQSNSVHLLILAKAPMDVTNRAGHTPLRGAIEAGLAGSAAQLIAAGASLTNGVGDTTLLHIAARVGSAETAKLLLAHGLALDARDAAGRTPLQSALDAEQWSTMTFLRNQGANLNAADHAGNTALHLLAEKQYETVHHEKEQPWWVTWQRKHWQTPGWTGKAFRWLYSTKLITPPPGQVWTNTSLTAWTVKQGANVNLTNRAGQTPLHALLSQSWMNHADLNESSNRIETLLAAGARLDLRDTNGLTALQVAAAQTRPETLLYLVRRTGVTLNDRDARGRTLLHTAVENATYDFTRVTLLLAAGANPNLTDAQGRTPLHLLLQPRHDGQDWQRSQFLQIFLTNGVNPNLADRAGNTPLHYVMQGYASNSSYQLNQPLALLLTNGANPNVTNLAGQTPLHIAARPAHPYAHPGEHLKPWIDPGQWDFSRRDLDGNTPVHLWAANIQNCWNCVEFFKTAVTNGQFANATNFAGNTPLHLALLAGQEHLARALMQCGADPLRQNSSGATALRLAIEKSTSYPLDQDVRPAGAESSFFNSLNGHDPKSLDLWLAADPTLCAVTNGTGLTPLLAATAQGNTNLANRLLTLGAPLDPLSALRLGRMDDFHRLLAARQAPPPNEWLFEAVRLGRLDALAALVLAEGDVQAVDGDGHSLLFRATAGKQDDLVTWLQTQPCRTTFFDLVINGDLEAARAAMAANPNLVNIPNGNGRTPLLRATAVGQTGMAALLLQHGAKSEAVTYMNWNALHFAAANDAADIGRLLLDAGLKPDQLTQNTLGALHIAAANGHTNMIALLLERGANPSLRPPGNGNWGHTPLHWAAQRGHVEAVRLLLAKGADVKVLNARQETPLQLARKSSQGGGFIGYGAPPEARPGFTGRRPPAENYTAIIQLLEQAEAAPHNP